MTALDLAGRPYVKDVAAGEMWYFPTRIPHSLQGLGADGCEFLLVFNDGRFSEDDDDSTLGLGHPYARGGFGEELGRVDGVA